MFRILSVLVKQWLVTCDLCFAPAVLRRIAVMSALNLHESPTKLKNALTNFLSLKRLLSFFFVFSLSNWKSNICLNMEQDFFYKVNRCNLVILKGHSRGQPWLFDCLYFLSRRWRIIDIFAILTQPASEDGSNRKLRGRWVGESKRTTLIQSGW